MGTRPFYDGTKLLSLSDLSGNKPEIYMCVGNRTAGKTYFFKRMLLRRFISKQKKFMLLVRFSYELETIADSFFKDLQQVDFKNDEMLSKSIGKDLFVELYFNGLHCGYAVALNAADTIKKFSSRFVDVDAMFMDEFQSETGKYTPDELTKFQSVHVSVARGGGQHVRYVPVYMCSNTVSILNPYFATFGVAKRLNADTKFLKGNGWVLELCYVESAGHAIKNSGFAQAFENSSYMKFAIANQFLLDNNHFIEALHGNGRMFCVIISEGEKFGIWDMKEQGLYYVSHKFDPNYPKQITFKTIDHNINYIMLKNSAFFTKRLKECFDVGIVRFEDLACKDVFVEFIGYSLL